MLELNIAKVLRMVVLTTHFAEVMNSVLRPTTDGPSAQ